MLGGSNDQAKIVYCNNDVFNKRELCKREKHSHITDRYNKLKNLRI